MENITFCRCQNVVLHNVGWNEGDPGAIHPINNSESVRVNFLDGARHAVGSPFSSMSLSHCLGKRLVSLLFFRSSFLRAREYC